MSSIWEVVIWSRYADQLMPELARFADDHHRSAAFVRPSAGDEHMGAVDVITGEVNHLDPDALLDAIRAVHAADRSFLHPVTVLLSNEYDLGEPPRVHQLGGDGIWR